MNFKDGGTTFTVIFSKKTHLPAIVRTQDDDAVRGTANYEVRFDELEAGRRRADRTSANLHTQ